MKTKYAQKKDIICIDGKHFFEEQSAFLVKSHADDIVTNISRIHLEQGMHDVILRTGDVEIPAHRLVLASCSPYFEAMFTSNMLESKTHRVTLEEVTPISLEKIIGFAYTGEICITENTAQDLLSASCLLQITAVKDLCCQFLRDALDPLNCLGIAQFADLHSCLSLCADSKAYAAFHILSVFRGDEFLSANFELVSEIIRRDDLNVLCVEQILDACLNWVRHDLCSRKTFLPKILSSVRLEHCEREYLTTNLMALQLIVSNPACVDLLHMALKYHLLPDQRVERPINTICTGAKISTIFAIGGGSLFSIFTDCEFLPLNGVGLSRDWQPMASLPHKRARAAVVSALGKVYAIGGFDGVGDLSTVECFTPCLNSWHACASMVSRRSCLGGCELNDLIVCCGGYDGVACLSSCERFDPLSDTWSALPAMSARRRYPAVISLDGYIYAIGGYDGSCHLPSVERYDPRERRWEFMTSMIHRRSNCGAAVFQNKIWVTGGNDGSGYLSSTEFFDPTRNSWHVGPPLHNRRCGHQLLVANNCLYALGGNDGSQSLDNVEIFSSEAGNWQTAGSMRLKRSNLGATVLSTIDIGRLIKKGSIHVDFDKQCRLPSSVF